MPTAKKAVKRVKGINALYFVLGGDGKKVPMKQGTTLGDFRVSKGLEGIEIAVNGTKAPDSYVIAEGDRITVVPKAKGGRA